MNAMGILAEKLPWLPDLGSEIVVTSSLHRQEVCSNDSNYPSVQEALSVVRGLQAMLTAGQVSSATEYPLSAISFNEGASTVNSNCLSERGICATELIAIGRKAAPSFEILFSACGWLPIATKDMVIELSLQTLLLYARMLVAAVEEKSVEADCHGEIKARHAEYFTLDEYQKHLCAVLTWLVHWCAVGYESVPGDIREALADVYVKTKSDVGVTDDVEVDYLAALVLLNFHTDSLRRSEIVAVASAIRRWASDVSLKQKQSSDEACIAIDIFSGLMWLQQSGYQSLDGTRYFERSHISDLFSLLGGLYDDKARKTNFHRWLSQTITKFSEDQALSNGHPGHSDRAPVRESCHVFVNYLPILDTLRSKADGRALATPGRSGGVYDISVSGCKISISVGTYHRPVVGSLIMVSSATVGERIAVVRRLRYADCRHKVTIGAEFVSGTPRIAYAAATKQWAGGSYAEKIIYLEPASTKMATPVSVVQRGGSHLDDRIISLGHEKHLFQKVSITEQGFDFDILECAETF